VDETRIAMRARVPASSANLGPGFDTLGLALQRYTEVTIEPAASFSLISEGEGSDLPRTVDHFAARIAADVLGHTNFQMHVRSEVPMTRGLGSSASMAVAAAAAAGHPDPFSYVANMEGHADNAAAAVLGGFVTGAMIDGAAVAHRLPLDEDLRFVVAIPDRHLRTAEARGVLPTQVPFVDVVFELGRLGQLIAGMADHRVLTPAATGDRLHQDQRGTLFPEARALMDSMIDAGALASCWSGAGPTLLAMCVEWTAEDVADRVRRTMASLDVAGMAQVIAPDLEGLVIES
jgi:homoserine kinase